MSQHPPRLHNCSMRRPQDVSLGRPHEVPSLTSGTASRTKREPPVFARSQTAKFLSHYHVTAIRGRAGKSGPGKSLDPPTPRSREILFRWVAAQKQSTANAPIIRFILRTSTTSVDRSRKPAAPRPASRQYVPASSCAKPLPGIQRPRGSHAERPLRQTAGVVRFRSSLEGLTDKGRELFRKYSEQFYPSDVLRSSGLELVRCGCGRTYRLLDYGQ